MHRSPPPPTPPLPRHTHAPSPPTQHNTKHTRTHTHTRARTHTHHQYSPVQNHAHSKLLWTFTMHGADFNVIHLQIVESGQYIERVACIFCLTMLPTFVLWFATRMLLSCPYIHDACAMTQILVPPSATRDATVPTLSTLVSFQPNSLCVSNCVWCCLVTPPTLRTFLHVALNVLNGSITSNIS